MVVQHNMQAANASRVLNITANQQTKSTEKLSSGYRINRAADDAAGLSISEKMRRQIRGLDRASTNAQDGISAVQTAEGALAEVHSMLQRANELAVQAANGTNATKDIKAISDEIQQLKQEITRIATTTDFNGKKMLATTTNSASIFVGYEKTTDNAITISGVNVKTQAANNLGSAFSTSSAAKDLISTVKAALQNVSDMRSKFGAVQNRLEHTVDNLDNVVENVTAAESRIRDTDMADEMVKYSKNNILTQAGQSMLAQANQSTQGVLSLLQ